MKAMRNPYATHIDYECFKGIIPNNPNFMPSNIDGIIERNGNFIVFEWKRPGEKFNTGQIRLLQALAKTPRFIVIIMCGDTDNGLNFDHCWLYDEKGKASKKYTTFEEFVEFFKLWYDLQ